MTAPHVLDVAEPPRRDETGPAGDPKVATEANAGAADLDQRVRARLASDLGEDAQSELARLLRCRAQLRSTDMQSWLVERVELGIEALLQSTPKLEFARAIRRRADLELLAHNGWVNRLFVRGLNANPGAIAGLGVVLTMLIGLPLVALLPAELMARHFFNFTMLDDTTVPMVAFAAFLGGAVSILSRLSDQSKLGEFDPLAVFLNGALKPCAGMLFGIFAYAVLNSGVISLGETSLDNQHAQWVIGFLAGFSERLPKDIVARGENLLAGR